jgi:Fic family protein
MVSYHSEATSLHSVERGAMLHAIFVDIYPFIDRNGRTVRLLLNLELMKEGFPSVIIKVVSRLEYYDALDKAHTSKDYHDFIQLVAKEVGDSLNLYLSVTNEYITLHSFLHKKRPSMTITLTQLRLPVTLSTFLHIFKLQNPLKKLLITYHT